MNASKITTTGIQTRAMLTQLSISIWSARKTDKAVTAEVHAMHGAVSDAGRYHKHLIGGRSKSKAYSDVQAAAGELRAIHNCNTLPWSADGWRILSTANWVDYTSKMRKALAAFESAAAQFVAEYADVKAAAKVSLGNLYSEADYPSERAIAHKFSARTEFAPIPSRGDLRVELDKSQIQEIERDISDRVARATEEAMRDAWARLYDVVEKVRVKLSEPDAIFRDSLIENVGEITEVLGRLNVTGDKRLEEMRTQVAEQLAQLDPDALRKDPETRNDAAARAQAIIDQMSAIYSPAS